MKLIFSILLILNTFVFAQFKSEAEKNNDILGNIATVAPSSFLSNFFSPEHFKMKHSVGMSYASFGGNGIALGVYTNSMMFNFGGNFDAVLETSFVNSPYSSFGQEHQNSINGIYISNAQINYRPSENTEISVGFRQFPAGIYSPYGFSTHPFSTFRSSQFGEDQ